MLYFLLVVPFIQQNTNEYEFVFLEMLALTTKYS